MPALKKLLLLLLLLGTSACSSEYLYNIGQEWQRHECLQIEDAADRSACLDNLKGFSGQSQQQ